MSRCCGASNIYYELSDRTRGLACGGARPQALGRWGESYRHEKRRVLRMEFKTFLSAFIRVPCQILRAGRRIVYRLLQWNPWQDNLLHGVEALQNIAALRDPLGCGPDIRWDSVPTCDGMGALQTPLSS